MRGERVHSPVRTHVHPCAPTPLPAPPSTRTSALVAQTAYITAVLLRQVMCSMGGGSAAPSVPVMLRPIPAPAPALALSALPTQSPTATLLPSRLYSFCFWGRAQGPYVYPGAGYLGQEPVQADVVITVFSGQQTVLTSRAVTIIYSTAMQRVCLADLQVSKPTEAYFEVPLGFGGIPGGGTRRYYFDDFSLEYTTYVEGCTPPASPSPSPSPAPCPGLLPTPTVVHETSFTDAGNATSNGYAVIVNLPALAAVSFPDIRSVTPPYSLLVAVQQRTSDAEDVKLLVRGDAWGPTRIHVYEPGSRTLQC